MAKDAVSVPSGETAPVPIASHFVPAVVPRFFAALLSGVAPVIYGRGEQSRDFTFVGDAVAANLLAAEAPADACDAVYNVAGGRRVTIAALARAVREAVGGGPLPRHEPVRPGDVLHSHADLSAARARLGYAPRVSLAEGLAAAREHLQLAETRRVAEAG